MIFHENNQNQGKTPLGELPDLDNIAWLESKFTGVPTILQTLKRERIVEEPYAKDSKERVRAREIIENITKLYGPKTK
ncbi:MAG: hypothetical protein NVSMB66_6490 [Candidatus Doudnabacteria bacterium]